MRRYIPGTDGLYEVAIEDNNIYCISHHKTTHILKNTVTPKGYIFWDLKYSGKRHNRQVGYWVALTYPELVQNDYFEGAEIDHIDTNTLNNHPSNLKWVTHTGNINNPLTRKHRAASLKGVFLNHASLSKPVKQYTLQGELVAVYPSQMEAHRVTGISQGLISAVCRGERTKTGGFYWTY